MLHEELYQRRWAEHNHWLPVIQSQIVQCRLKEKWGVRLLGTRKGWESNKIRTKEKYFIMWMKKRENWSRHLASGTLLWIWESHHPTSFLKDLILGKETVWFQPWEGSVHTAPVQYSNFGYASEPSFQKDIWVFLYMLFLNARDF